MTILKKHPVLVPIGIALISLIIVMPSASRTISLGVQYLNLKRQLSSSGLRVPGAFETEARKLLPEVDIDPAKVTFDALSISSQQHKVLLRKAEPPKIAMSGDIEIHTQQIVLEGEFAPLIKTLNDIRDELKLIRISSLKFQTIEQNKKILLQAYVTFQYAKPTEYEND